MPPGEDAITGLLWAWNAGEPGAFDKLAPFVYTELRKLAESYMRGERPGHTLQPTALVHEVYLRLIKQRMPKFENRAHFYGLSAQLMRQVLVDSARSRAAAKRAGAMQPVDLDGMMATGTAQDLDVLELDSALGKLALENEHGARAIELHYFGGLSVAEISGFTGRSERTVARDLASARIFLARVHGSTK